MGFYEFRPEGYQADASKKYPLIIFLHGWEERGDGSPTKLPLVLNQGIPKEINSGSNMTFIGPDGNSESFVVLSPQLSTSFGVWQNPFIDSLLRYAKNNLKIDTNRIYLTGLSLGGGGVWGYASGSYAKAQQFAAIAPIQGVCWWDYKDTTNLRLTIAKANIGIWSFL